MNPATLRECVRDSTPIAVPKFRHARARMFTVLCAATVPTPTPEPPR